MDVIGKCIDSLIRASCSDKLAVVVVDNKSVDETLAVLTQIKEDVATADAWLKVFPLRRNNGYAYAVNRGIEVLFSRTDVSAFWILNPDCVVPSSTPAALFHFVASRDFGLASGRCLYHHDPEIIQTDGGRVSRISGLCSSANVGRRAADTPLPDTATLDYLTGAHLLASRRFIEQVGPMAEDYFLYYEEVDWAFRRREFSLELIEGAEILHHGGTSIGSGGLDRPASAFSNYFNHRNRIRFVWRFFPWSIVLACAWSVLKAGQVLLKVGRHEAVAMVCGVLGLPPTSAVRLQNPSAFER